VTLILTTFGYCVVSALVPVVNAEAYVAGVAAVFDGFGVWSVALAAASGQMVGKVVYFLLGRDSLRWRWVRAKTESPKWRDALGRWQRRVGGNPWLGGLLLFVSAWLGVPPFAVMSVIAGQLRVPLAVFLAAGLAGRLGRFVTLLGLVEFATGG
jgi:membrane protein YqaA with SNARE-associated domain